MAQSSITSRRGGALSTSLSAPRSLSLGALAWQVAPAAVACGAFLTYLATMAPTVTWKNGGADGAELAAAAWVWGVGHEPGYPLYLTLVRLVQYVPLGEVIYRAALFSAATAALSVVLVYATVREILREPGSDIAPWQTHAGALFAAACWAFGPQLWSQAVIAEVYGLTGLLLACSLWSLARWLRAPTAAIARLAVLAVTLLATHHPPFALLFLPLALLAWRTRLPRAVWLQAFAIMLLGPLLMLTEWLRSAFQPPLDWGLPTTPERWLAQVTARDYQHYVASQPLADTLRRIPYAASLLLRQGGIPAMALSMLGLSWLWPRRRFAAAVLSAIAVSFVGFLALYNVRDVENYLLPTIQVLAIAAGVGTAWLFTVQPSPRARLLIGLVLAGSVAWQVWSGWPEVDVSHDREARTWGESTLAAAPPDAVVRSDADEHTFVLWYLQAAEDLRPDVAIVDTRLWQVPWYRELLARRYPLLAESLGAPCIEQPATDCSTPPAPTAESARPSAR